MVWKGYPATPVGPAPTESHVTWRVPLPNDGTSVTAADVACQYASLKDDSDIVTGFEVVAP